jgi:hypothetical protein
MEDFMTIRWENDYASALARARTEHKPVFVDLFSPT